MGFFDKLNPFHKKERSSDMDMGGMGKDPFGAPSTSDFGSQNFPDAWNTGGGMDSGIGGMGGNQSLGMGSPPLSSPQSFGQNSQFPSPPQQSYSPSQPSFSQQSTFQSVPNFSQQSYAAPQPAYGDNADYMHSKNLEVISSKIDALRAAIDSMNARLQNIERIAGQEEENRRKRYY
jgi:hypothetical protein